MRIEDYTPKHNALASLDLQVETLETRAQNTLSGAKYVIRYSHELQKLVALPTHLTIESPFSHALDYGSGAFEGLSAMLNERTGVPHIILLQARSQRMFDRTLPSIGYSSPITLPDFKQSITDLIAIHGDSIFYLPDQPSKSTRVYIRPTIHPASLTGYGLGISKDCPIDLGIVAWTWPDYLNPKIFAEGGIAAVTGAQRLQKIVGKHASNYGWQTVTHSKLARSLGADELFYLAPYYLDENKQLTYDDPNDFEMKLKYGTLCDGPGEECFAIDKDQKKFVYPPMRTNRLSGTTLQYVIDHMAINVGLIPEERDITLHDIRNHKYAALGMIGNAVKIAPIRQLQIFREKSLVDATELFSPGDMPEKLAQLIYRWDQETRGLIDPSHDSLLTPVDLVRGKQIRRALDNIFT